jgi:glycosyltransferase involved in cell wall biosynthesis
MLVPLVSVMMPAYNCERFIGDAIESLRAQTYQEWELIVVNDGSTDGTAQVARAFRDPRITVIDQRNAGESSARNTALTHMWGEFVAFLDADDLYLPRHIEAAAAVLRAEGQIDATYSDGFYCDERGRFIQTLSSRRIPPSDGDIFDRVLCSSAMLGPPVCVVMRRAPVLAHSLEFDPGITIGPDWDFFVRFAETGRFKCIPEMTCGYRLHGQNISSVTGLAKRSQDLAKCRWKAVHMQRFEACAPEVRATVFYDLVVNLLLGRSEEQERAARSEPFGRLPRREQSRLLRLMASKAVLYGEDLSRVSDWLRRSLQARAWDFRTLVVWAAYRLSPALCRLLLTARARGEIDPRRSMPFADIPLPSDKRVECAHRLIS